MSAKFSGSSVVVDSVVKEPSYTKEPSYIKKPTIGRFIKGTGLAGLVYELGKEVLKIENAMPTDKEEREIFRKGIIESNMPKVTYDKEGRPTYELGQNINLKDHLPYKKQTMFGGMEEFVLVDPYDEIYGPIDDDRYELTETGYVKKNRAGLIERVFNAATNAYEDVVHHTPPELRKVVGNVRDIGVESVKLVGKGMGF
jgi:hypothetical protein